MMSFQTGNVSILFFTSLAFYVIISGIKIGWIGIKMLLIKYVLICCSDDIETMCKWVLKIGLKCKFDLSKIPNWNNLYVNPCVILFL